MFCKYCGNEVADDVKFCSKCGKNLTNDANQNNTSQATNNVNSTVQIDEDSIVEKLAGKIDKSDYSGTSFKLSLCGLIFCWCCGLPLFLGPLGAIFGGLAIKNKEPNVGKAYIGLGLGCLETLALIVGLIVGIKNGTL